MDKSRLGNIEVMMVDGIEVMNCLVAKKYGKKGGDTKTFKRVVELLLSEFTSNDVVVVCVPHMNVWKDLDMNAINQKAKLVFHER